MSATAPCTPRLIVVAFSGDGQNASLLHRSVDHFRAAESGCGCWCYDLTLLPMTTRDNFFCRVERLRVFLREQCEESIVLHVDCYDTFLATTAATLLERFRAMRSGVVWAAESEYTWQDARNRSFYDALSQNRSRYRYVNGGGYIGYVRALRPIFEAARFVSKFKGADQMAFSRLFADGCAGAPHAGCEAWRRWDVRLDYAGRLFYVASGKDWDYRVAKERLRAVRPAHVHVAWTHHAPNRRLLVRLFDELVRAPLPPLALPRGARRAWWDAHSGKPFWAPADAQGRPLEEHCHGGEWPAGPAHNRASGRAARPETCSEASPSVASAHRAARLGQFIG